MLVRSLLQDPAVRLARPERADSPRLPRADDGSWCRRHERDVALIQGVLLRPLPVPDQDRLVVAWKALPSAGAQWPLGRAELDATARASRTLAAVGGVSYYGTWPENATERGLTTSITTALVTGAFFDVLGVRPVLGRTLNPATTWKGPSRSS